jgi:hypothetical protein
MQSHLHFEVFKKSGIKDLELFFTECFDSSKTYGPEEMVYPTGCPKTK